MGESIPYRIQIAFARGGVSALEVAADLLEKATRLWSGGELAQWLRTLAEEQTHELVKLGAVDADRAALEDLLREALPLLRSDAGPLQREEFARKIEFALGCSHPAFPPPRGAA